MARMNWIIEHPWPLTKIALTGHGRFRLVRSVRIGGAELWDAAFDAPGPWRYIILGSTFTSEEEGRGACRDYAEMLTAEHGEPGKWPFIRRPA